MNKEKKPIKPATKKVDLKHTGHVSTGSKITKTTVVNFDSKKPTHRPTPSEHKIQNQENKNTDFRKTMNKDNKEEFKKFVKNLNPSEKEEEKEKEIEKEKEKESLHMFSKSILPSTTNVDFNTGQMKKLNEEKKDLMHQVSILKRENADLKTKLEESEKVNNELINTIDESQKSSEQFIKDKKEMENIVDKYQKEINDLKEKNEELNKKIKGLEEDIEINKEENQTKDLENELLKKKYEDLSNELEDLKKNPQIENPINNNSNNNNNNNNNIEKTNNQNSEFSTEEISHMEEIIAELSNQLKQTSEQRDYAIQYYKEEIEKLTNNLNEEKEKNSIIPEKDDLIHQLTEKLKDYEAIMESLKSQITALSPSSNMFEEVIMEKDKLENELEELKIENEKLKEDLQNDEEMVNDLDTALKISEEMMKNSQIEVSNMKKKEEEYEKKFIELDENEKKLLEKLNELKQSNQFLKEELSKNQNSNINLDDVLNNNLTTINKIKMLQRQKVLNNLIDLDNEKYLLRNKLINAMIPKKMFEKGYLGSFDKFLNIFTYRKKTLELIFNILENDILTDDLGTNPNKNSDNKLEKVEGDNLKYLCNFYQLILNSLSIFNSILFKIEIHLCKIPAEKFQELTLSKSFINLYNNFCSTFLIIDKLINVIKQNMFSIKFKSSAEELKLIVESLKNQINNVEEIEDDNLYNYSSNTINYYITISCSFKKERIDIILNDLDNDNKLNDIANNFKSIYSSLKQLFNALSKKFFNDISYENSNKIFDTTSPYYTKFIETYHNLKEETSKDDIVYNLKYENLLEILNKVLILMSTNFEKFESENEKDENKKENENSTLPISEWNKITDELNTELESVAKIQEDSENAKKEVKQVKLEKIEMQNKYEDLVRSKNESEQKLAKLQMQIGKVTELEVQNEEKNKYISKYKMAIDNLQLQNERDKNNIEQLNSKIEKMEKDKKELEKRNLNKIDKNSILGSSFIGDIEKNLEATLTKLLNERKNLKNKLMKKKLINLINDENSYMNKFIMDLKISKDENEKELYNNFEHQIINLNNNYKKARMKLSLPKILDLTNSKSVNQENINQRETELNKLRIDYMKDYDILFSKIFTDSTSNFKNLMDHDVSKALKYYAEKPLLIGKVRFYENNEKIKKDANAINNNIKKIPVLLSEENLKKLNETFNY